MRFSTSPDVAPTMSQRGVPVLRIDPGFSNRIIWLLACVANAQFVLGDMIVPRHEGQPLCLGLGNEHAVEGVAMQWGEGACQLAVVEGDGEFVKPFIFDDRVHVIGGYQLVQGDLD